MGTYIYVNITDKSSEAIKNKKEQFKRFKRCNKKTTRLLNK